MQKFKWDIKEFNERKYIGVDYCRNVYVPIDNLKDKQSNYFLKVFTPPNPYIDYNKRYEEDDRDYINRADLAFKAVKEGYGDIVFSVLTQRYQFSNFCVHFVPIKFLDEKIGKEVNGKFNSIFGNMKFCWMIRTCSKNNPKWNVCMNSKGFLSALKSKDAAENYVNYIKEIAKKYVNESSRLSFDRSFEDYFETNVNYKKFFKKWGGLELLNDYIELFSGKTKESPAVQFECIPNVSVKEYTSKIDEIVLGK